MPLLRNGELVCNDNWILIEDESDLPKNHSTMLISLTRYLALQHSETNSAVGVLLTPTDDVHLLSPHKRKLKLIGIEFPSFTEGRGYTQARLLRKRIGYQGELRAFGDIREDQVSFMQRNGIDSFHFADQPDKALVQQLVSRFKTGYQPSYQYPG